MSRSKGDTPELTVLAYAFPTEAASLAGFRATMAIIAGGSAYRLKTPDGSLPPALVVFAIANTLEIQDACIAAGGTPTTIEPDMLLNLAARSRLAAMHNIVGQRHYEEGTRATEALPDNQSDYSPREERGHKGEER